MFAQRHSKETDTFNYGVVCFRLILFLNLNNYHLDLKQMLNVYIRLLSFIIPYPQQYTS